MELVSEDVASVYEDVFWVVDVDASEYVEVEAVKDDAAYMYVVDPTT